jgi:signal transduction histidine kinase/ligand-binding sensor domain-containing protein/DNA-binding NarL/FixJ family response regulator
MKHENVYMRMICAMMMLLWVTTAWPMADGGRWRFHSVDVKDGLADNFVRDIMTDSEGYIWLSTINGVSRYDGYRFLNFQPQQFGSRSGDVMMVRETADGTLWMMSSGDLFTYRRAEQTWQKDGMDRLRQMGIEGSKVSKFYVDDDGDLWTVTEQGLYHQSYHNTQLIRIDCRGLAPILHILAKNGMMLVVTADYNIYKVTANAKLTLLTRHPYLTAESRDNRAIIDSRMNLWLYHAHSPVNSLWIYSLGSGNWQKPNALSQMGGDASVNAIAEDRDGRLWMGTGNRGIHVLEWRDSVDVMSTLLPMNSHITCLYADVNNTMWVGSAKFGAAYADLNSPEFIHITTNGHEDVSALMEDALGNLWIGFDGEGILMKGRNGANTIYSALKGQLSSDNITTIATDGKGSILAGSYGGGIARFDGKRFVPLYPDYDQLHYVKAIVADCHGSLWVATVDKGVVRITAERRFTNFTAANSPLRSDGIICLTYDTSGDRIYIGTSIGLAAYDCSRGSFIEDNTLDSLKNVNVTALLFDDSGRLWIGSRDGLWVKGLTLQHLTTEQGLTHNVVRALARSGGTIWASTDNGLTSITAKGNILECRPFFDSDGLQGMIFSNNAALTTSDGTVLLGSQKGYVSISGDSNKLRTELTDSPPNLHVAFTEFRINGNPVVKSPQGFSIEYGERLGVSISMMVPVLSHKARYFYRFKGEKEWMRAPSNILYFASLMPGNHVLQVKAELPGMATTEVSELFFKVLPPFWLSKWAILCYLLLLAAAGWLVWRAIRRRQQREVAMKQMEINLKKYEMEEDKIRFFTNISHDLKTPLTLVVAPLEKIREHNLPETIRTEIDVAWRNAHQLYDLVLELLDFRRLDVGKEKLNLSHGDLVSFVRQTAQAFAYYTTRKQIELLLELPTTSVETLFDENKMRRVITNLLSNAYKYNVDGGNVTVTLEVHHQEATLSVADTGIGVKDKHHIFDRFVQETHGQEQEGSGLGLHIVRQYVDMMAGSITVSDNQPRGTIFTVMLPLKRESTAEMPSEEEGPQGYSQPKVTTVLIVEDNTDARLFLQRSLENEYRVLLAANGKEALNQLVKYDNVNIIISDVMMPVMDGMEFVRQIRKNIRFSHIPVILLTAKSSEEDIIAGLQEGVADYLTKPYSLAVLRLRIKKILEWTQHVHKQVATGIEIKPSEITVSSLDEELISHVITEVESNIANPTYSVVQLSAAVGMTRGTLYKKLMAIVGKSPVEFIRIIRLKRGKDLLDQGRTNVSEVADKVGISPKIFAQYFREMYGSTPSDYLKRQKKKTLS